MGAGDGGHLPFELSGAQVLYCAREGNISCMLVRKYL